MQIRKKILIVLLISLILLIISLVSIKLLTYKEVRTIEYKGTAKVLTGTENTTWQDEYVYNLDEGNNTITLQLYKGNHTELIVPSKAIIEGKEYRTKLKDSPNGNPIWTSQITNIEVTKLEFEGGIMLPTDCSYMFFDCSGLTTLDVSKFDTSNVTNMKDMFSGCSSLEELDLSNFDTSKVTKMDGMFEFCSKLTELDISSFDTSKVTEMDGMFESCSKLTELDISSFNTSNVTNMSYMFHSCSSLTQLDLSDFSTSNVTDMSVMFGMCENLTQLDLGNFDTKNVTDMQFMFEVCSSLTQLDLSSFDTSNVSNMEGMFVECKNLTELNLSNFDTSNVTDMSSMFNDCKKLEELDIKNFDTSNVSKMSGMFGNCENLKQLDISSFDTSKVTEIQSMFYGCSSLAQLDLSSFNLEKVTDVRNMLNNTDLLKSIEAPLKIAESMNVNLSGNYYIFNEEDKIYNNTPITALPIGLNKSVTLVKLDNRVTNIELDTNKITMDMDDDSKTITATVYPINATDPRVSWTSSNKEIVKVEEGRLIPVGNGTATVTAKTYDGGLTASAEITVGEELDVTINRYNVKQEGETKYLKGIKPGETLEQIKANIQTNGTIKMYKGEIEESTIVATGNRLVIEGDFEQVEEYTIVVTGDLNGDGQMEDIDVLKLARYKAGLDTSLEGEYLEAADLNNDNEYAGDIDLLKMARILVGLSGF